MEGLAELHTHLGGSVSSDILWSLAHQQGIALPVKDFWDFDRLVTVSDPRGVPDLDSLDAIYHWTELIQSSPAAVEVSVHGAIGGAYRSQGITTLELRFNPMKRNRGGEEGAEMGRAEIGDVLELLRPDRIGHGIVAAGDAELMRELREREVVLEICPTSNLLTKSLPDEAAVRDVFHTFVENGVLF